ncbi:MAG: tetratricopeptide repeat protein [Thermomicrobiales bacterium]
MSWLERGLDLSASTAVTHARARATRWAGRIALSLSDFDRQERYLTLARTLWEELGDQRGIAVSLTEYSSLLWRRGEIERSAEIDQQALAIHRAVGNPWGIAHCLVGIGAAKAMAGRHDEAITWYTEGINVCRASGDISTEAWVEAYLAMAIFNTGDLARGAAHAQNMERLARLLDDRRKLVDALYLQAGIALEQAEYQQGLSMAAEAASIFGELGNVHTEAIALFLLGGFLLRLDRLDEAVATYARALPTWVSMGTPVEVATCLQETAPLALALGRADDAALLLGAGEARRAALNAPTSPPDQERFGEVMATARELRGDAVAEKAWHAGQEMSLEAAIALALDVCHVRAEASAA